MNILGLDLSLRNTGWVVLTDEGKLKASGVIKSKKRGVERLCEISYNFYGTIIIPHEPEIAVIEGYAFGIRHGMSFSIGELGGIIKKNLFESDISYYTVAPPSLKKFITGKGRCDKNEIMKEVYKKWNVDLKTEHQNDAYGLARIGLEISKFQKGTNPKKLLKYEQEVIKRVLKDEAGNNWIKEN